MKSLLLRALAIAILCAGMAAAQNSDLGLLLGVSVGPSATITPGRVEGSVSASGQLNYAIQLREANRACSTSSPSKPLALGRTLVFDIGGGGSPIRASVVNEASS